MKNRNQYAKTIRRIEIGSNFLLIIGILVSFFMSWGLPGTIGTVVLYILLMAYNFTLMKRCRCDSCGHVDVFTKSAPACFANWHACTFSSSVNKEVSIITFVSA